MSFQVCMSCLSTEIVSKLSGEGALGPPRVPSTELDEHTVFAVRIT